MTRAGRLPFTFLGLCLAYLAVSVNLSITSIALPSIGEDLGASTDQLSWIFAITPLVSISVMLFAGAWGDRFGRRRILVIGLSIFLASAILSALARDVTALIALPKSFGTFVEYTNVIGLLGFRNAVEQFANRKLVCIDEFELDDPGDTVLMSTFLNELVDRGVNVAATSNTLPDRLGEERFAADNFLREIQGLSAHFDVIRIEGPDYRQRNLDLNQRVFTDSQVEKICAATTNAAMDNWQGLLDHLSQVHPAQYGPMVEDLSLLGLLDVNVVRNETQALRVVSLVDRLYDRSVPIVNSGVDITSIFTDSMLKGGYRKKYFRALSRLAAVVAPKLTRRAIKAASTVPNPPGVMGIINPIWAIANAANAAAKDVPALSQPSTPRKAT